MKSISLASLGGTGRKIVEVLRKDVKERHNDGLAGVIEKIKQNSEPQDNDLGRCFGY